MNGIFLPINIMVAPSWAHVITTLKSPLFIHTHIV